MRNKWHVVSLCLLINLISACANKTMVALVPDPEGKVGMIAVGNQAGSVAISTPYQTTTIDSVNKPPTAPTAMDREDLRKKFADAISALPQKPLRYLFYFEHETVPSRESLEALPSIVAAIRERKSGYISVIGHADTTGEREYNIDVTLRRAIAVRDLLVERGVTAVTIYPSWVGEDHLLIRTEDEVREPKNRGVEVVVR